MKYIYIYICIKCVYVYVNVCVGTCTRVCVYVCDIWTPGFLIRFQSPNGQRPWVVSNLLL